MQNDTSPAPLLLDPVRAAQALAISPRTLWGLKKTGQIPAIKIGRLTRYAVADLGKFVAERRAATAPVLAGEGTGP